MVRTVTSLMLRLYFDYNIDENESLNKILNCPNTVRSVRQSCREFRDPYRNISKKMNMNYFK